ncbi:MAG: septum site-determining protein MinC [Pseudomonadota bacterium]|jgi:septum site-determining protein MinC
MPPDATAASAFDIKSADLPLMAFRLKTADLAALTQALNQQLGATPGFFEREPALIDLEALPADSPAPDLLALLPVLKAHGLLPLAVRGMREAWQDSLGAQLQASGLALAEEARVRRGAESSNAAQPAAAPEPVRPQLADAMVIDKPLRSGQQCYARGRDLVVLAAVNPGAEVIADGHIHIYAPLRGKAIAGARGFGGARIFAQHMDPELIAIAGVYRTSENPLPDAVRGRPAQVLLHSGPDGERLQISPLGT